MAYKGKFSSGSRVPRPAAEPVRQEQTEQKWSRSEQKQRNESSKWSDSTAKSRSGAGTGENRLQENRRGACKPQSRAAKWCRKHPVLIFLYLYLAVVIPELALRAFSVPKFGGPGLLLLLLFSLVPALLVYGIVMALKEKAAFAAAMVYSAVLFLFYASQTVYFESFNRHYIVNSVGNAGQVVQFMNIIIQNIFRTLPWLLLIAVPTLFLAVFGRRLLNFHARTGWTFAPAMAVCALLVHFVVVLLLPLFGTGAMTPYDLYHHTFDTENSIQELGMGAYFRLDFHRMVFDLKESGGLQPVVTKPTDAPATEGTAPTQGTNPDDPTQEATDPTEADLGLNVLNIDFDALIAGESDDAINTLHAYFRDLTPSSKNEKTGMFKGKNLIFITAESFSYFAIDKELTPTLYKMQHEGVNFTNFYVPGWGVSTTDGEYVNLCGTIPKAGVWSMYRAADNYMPLPMSAQLKKLGYNTFAYHDHDYDYYDRDVEYPNLGFDVYKAYGKGLDVTKTWPESDLEMVDLTTVDYIAKRPFYTYYLTVSQHANWNFNGNYIAYKNKDLVSHLSYSEDVRGYLACAIELDKAMELLLERLDDAGIAENTVICLTADHNPYMMTAENLKELTGHEVDQTFEVYKNACLLYCKGMTPETVDEPCCAMDLLPTLSNLFGLDFDSRLYMGRDIFSDAPPLVIFLDRSWITDKCMYNANTGEVTSLDGSEISDDYVEQIKNEVYNKFTVSTRILDYDYWNILFGDEKN